jgi:hypothetical protein
VWLEDAPKAGVVEVEWASREVLWEYLQVLPRSQRPLETTHKSRDGS